MCPATFTKRFYTLPSFLTSLDDLLTHMDDLVAAAGQRRVSRALAEKIMMAVTQVNGCRYCSYVHTRQALKAGVTQTELHQLMAHELGALPADEVFALAFAQHYAEQAGRPDPEAWQQVVDTYGPDTARDVLAYVRLITFGNLMGNTFDAFLSRLQGNPAPNSRALHEIAVLGLALVAVPFGLSVWGLSRLLPGRIRGRLGRALYPELSIPVSERPWMRL